ncbi:MAG TPA: alpha/beta fold hydrolase [Solirubrobacteraceae bacterium]|nr:alpha/beta fold hydrolase [Solirubrobacteraceae bacterium]
MSVISPPAADPAALRAYGPVGRSAWRDIDWREHHRWVRVRGRWVNCVELGEGQPLVFVHGLAGSWQNWLENIPYFAATHHVFALDLPGFGLSETPSEPISIDGYARMLDDFLDAVGLPDEVPLTLVGNSMGGFIAAEVAIRYSQRVGRLVLVSAAGITSESQRNDRLFAIVQRLEFLLTFMAQHPDARFMLRPRYKRLAKLVFEHPGRLPGSLVYEQLKGSGKPGFVPSLGAVTRYPIRDRLARIIAPTPIVWGERDRIVPPRDAQVFEQAIGHATRIMYPDTGHVPMLERPARFNHDVAAWLASEQAGTTQ